MAAGLPVPDGLAEAPLGVADIPHLEVVRDQDGLEEVAPDEEACDPVVEGLRVASDALAVGHRDGLGAVGRPDGLAVVGRLGVRLDDLR